MAETSAQGQSRVVEVANAADFQTRVKGTNSLVRRLVFVVNHRTLLSETHLLDCFHSVFGVSSSMIPFFLLSS